MLAYLFDYNQKPDYETGYLSRFVKNLPLREKVAKVFENKHSVGLRVFNTQRKLRNYSLPQNLASPSVPTFLSEEFTFTRSSFYLISQNSIPTSYGESEYPTLLLGENAKYIDLASLKNGAILDIPAAQILQSRGVDVGLISATPCSFSRELYLAPNDSIPGIGNPNLQKIEVSNKAIVESVFLPGSSPASYRYENTNGERFFVMAFDSYPFAGNYSENYYNNYYRQEQLKNAIEWACGKKLPAFTEKNTCTYLLASKGEDGAMAIAIANVYPDDINELEIILDKEYSSLKCTNANAKLVGNKVIIDHVSPYGFVLLEVK
jgi:hypothetical protein